MIDLANGLNCYNYWQSFCKENNITGNLDDEAKPKTSMFHVHSKHPWAQFPQQICNINIPVSDKTCISFLMSSLLSGIWAWINIYPANMVMVKLNRYTGFRYAFENGYLAAQYLFKVLDHILENSYILG